MSIKRDFIKIAFTNSNSHLMIVKYLFNQCPFFMVPTRAGQNKGQLKDIRYLDDSKKAWQSMSELLEFLADMFEQFTIKELVKWEFTNLSETEINKFYLDFIRKNKKANISFSSYSLLINYLVGTIKESGICKRVEEELGEVKTKKQIKEIKTWVYDEGM